MERFTRGTRVLVKTTNGGKVEGTLLDSFGPQDVGYGATTVVLRVLSVATETHSYTMTIPGHRVRSIDPVAVPAA